MNGNEPQASIIIVNWNGKRFLKSCLDSVFNQSYTSYTVFLIDNASTDKSAELVKQNYKKEIESKKLKLIINDKNYGFSEGNNIGIRQALKASDTKYIITLNADTVAEKDWLEKLVTAVESDPKIGMCQGKILLMNRKKIDSTGLLFYRSATWWDRGEGEEDVCQYDSQREVFGVCAAAALYRREMLENIQINTEFFDRDFFGYCEDIDLSVRGRLRGWRAVYEPKAVVYHHRGGTTGPQTRFLIYHTERNNLLLIFKVLPTNFIIKNFPLILLAQMGEFVVYLHRKRLQILLKAKIDAVHMLRKMIDKRRKFFKKSTKVDLNKVIEKNILPPVSAVPSLP